MVEAYPKAIVDLAESMFLNKEFNTRSVIETGIIYSMCLISLNRDRFWDRVYVSLILHGATYLYVDYIGKPWKLSQLKEPKINRHAQARATHL